MSWLEVAAEAKECGFIAASCSRTASNLRRSLLFAAHVHELAAITQPLRDEQLRDRPPNAAVLDEALGPPVPDRHLIQALEDALAERSSERIRAALRRVLEEHDATEDLYFDDVALERLADATRAPLHRARGAARSRRCRRVPCLRQICPSGGTLHVTVSRAAHARSVESNRLLGEVAPRPMDAIAASEQLRC